MPSAFVSTEGSLLGLQSSVGLALTHSIDLHSKEEALVRVCNFRFNISYSVVKIVRMCIGALFPASPLTAAHSFSGKLVTQLFALQGDVVQELHRPDKQVYSSLLLETWLNEVLHTSNPATPNASVKVSTHLPPGASLAHLAVA